MDVTKSMLIALVTPVVAVILGMIVLHEELNWRTIAGGALIMLGIGFIVIKKRRRQEAELVASAFKGALGLEAGMSDDQAKTGKPDRNISDTGRADELRDWARRFGVSVEKGAKLVEGPYVAETFRVSVENDYVVVEA